jgi:hypothetical protein
MFCFQWEDNVPAVEHSFQFRLHFLQHLLDDNMLSIKALTEDDKAILRRIVFVKFDRQDGHFEELRRNLKRASEEQVDDKRRKRQALFNELTSGK